MDIGWCCTGDGEMGSDQILHSRSINQATLELYWNVGGTCLFRRSWLFDPALSTAIQLCRGTTWKPGRKLNHPFNFKFCGAAQIRKEDRLRVTFVMELCKENLMGSTFQNQDYIPVLNTWCRERCNSMGERHLQCSRVHTQSGHCSQRF